MGDFRDEETVAEPTIFEKSFSRTLLDTTKEGKLDTDNVLSKENVQENSPVPTLVEAPQQQWNHPRINIWRTVVACYGLLIMGMNDAAYGVCTPQKLDWDVADLRLQAIIPYVCLLDCLSRMTADQSA